MNDRFAIPECFKPGLLPRKTLFGKLKGVPPLAEVVPLIDRDEWPELIRHENKPECSTAVWDVYDQDGVGSCASEAANKAHEIIRELAGRERVQFNPWFTYHTVSGGRDGGSSLDDNVVHLMEVGSCPESVYPRSKGWRATPPDEAYEAASKHKIVECFDISTSSRSRFEQEVGSALLLGFPVYFGYSGHAICGTELIDDKTVRYINSWGDWGDNGFGTIKLSSLMVSYGAFAFRVPTQPNGDSTS